MEAPRGVELTGTNGRGAIYCASSATAASPDDREHGHKTRNNETSRPSSGSRTATRNHPPSPRGRDEELKICGGHGPGETPGPIPNPEAKAWHGDGTAPERMWESSTPPHSPSQGPPVEHHAPGGPSHTHETRQKHAPGLGKKCGSYRACHDRPAQPLLMPKPPSWASTPTPNRPRPAPHDNTKRQVTIALPRDRCEPSRSRGRVMMVAGITHIVYAVGCGEGPHSVY